MSAPSRKFIAPDAFNAQFADVLAQIKQLSEGGTKSLVASQLRTQISIDKAAARYDAVQDNKQKNAPTLGSNASQKAFPVEATVLQEREQTRKLALQPEHPFKDTPAPAPTLSR